MRIRIISFCFLLLASACGPDAGKVAQTPSKRPSPVPPKPVFCPLTGVETSRDFPVGRPALGVKIENSVAARPQVGLDKADIVYEELAEGGITRFLAIYHCADSESLGPIRSARMVDPDILQEYAPVLFAHSGANPLVIEKIRDTKDLADLRHGNHGKAYHREKGRRPPHDLFSSTVDLRSLEDAEGFKGPPKLGFTFDAQATGTATSPSPKPTKTQGKATPSSSVASPSASPTPAPGAAVRFDYSGISNLVRYSYDAAARSYLRSHGETPHKVASGTQIRAVNVVILKVKVAEGSIRDAAGNYSPEIKVTGEGEAIVLRGGIATTGKWSRSSLANKTVLVDAAGKPIGLLPGNTWIHLVPVERAVSLS